MSAVGGRRSKSTTEASTWTAMSLLRARRAANAHLPWSTSTSCRGSALMRDVQHYKIAVPPEADIAWLVRAVEEHFCGTVVDEVALLPNSFRKRFM